MVAFIGFPENNYRMVVAGIIDYILLNGALWNDFDYSFQPGLAHRLFIVQLLSLICAKLSKYVCFLK